MTTCVATLCDARSAIVMAADKMISFQSVESEPDISKILPLHKNWRVMIAGNGIDVVFDIVDIASKKLSDSKSPDVTEIEKAMLSAYQEKRIADAEAIVLKPIGWTEERFNREGRNVLGESEFQRRLQRINNHNYELEFIIAGFDKDNKGHILSMKTYDFTSGIPQRQDMGFAAIGSGADNARFIMTYRRVGPKMKLREALYYTVEGKFYGEYASAVGLATSLYILFPTGKEIHLDEDFVNTVLMWGICNDLAPRDLPKKYVKILNSIPGLEEYPPMDDVPAEQEKKENDIETKWKKWMRGVLRS